jgi:hypothetical protein
VDAAAAAAAAACNSSRYALTSPSFFDRANLVRLTGTTCSLHTHAETPHNTTMNPIPNKVSVDGITASYVVVDGDVVVVVAVDMKISSTKLVVMYNDDGVDGVAANVANDDGARRAVDADGIHRFLPF